MAAERKICEWKGCRKEFVSKKEKQKFCSFSCSISSRNHNLVWKQSSKDKIKRSLTGKKSVANHKGQKSWCKGLTKETDERLMKISISKSGDKSPFFGKSPWNKGLTRDTDERVKINGQNANKHRKGKTFEEIYGLEGAREQKEIRKIKSRKFRLNEIEKNGGQLSMGKHEKQLLDEQEKIDNCKIERQYKLYDLGYILDGYCLETNTVYEVYEKWHNNRIEYDLKRQQEIENLLKCKFIIMKDEENGCRKSDC